VLAGITPFGFSFLSVVLVSFLRFADVSPIWTIWWFLACSSLARCDLHVVAVVCVLAFPPHLQPSRCTWAYPCVAASGLLVFSLVHMLLLLFVLVFRILVRIPPVYEIKIQICLFKHLDNRVYLFITHL
jgi:hypothetical protein